MLPRASNPIIAQAFAWVAVVMLLVQSLPAASCGCGGAATAGQPTLIECCSKSRAKSCCGSKPKSTCCSQQQATTCCSGDSPERSSVADGTCCCGTACRCSAAPTPSDTPIAPSQEDNRQERQEVVTLSSPSTMAIVAVLPQASRVASIVQLGCSTALDRCIELSRFTC